MQLLLFRELAGTDAETETSRTETVAEFAARWIETDSAPPMSAPYNQKVRRQFLRAYILPTLGQLPIDGISRADVLRLQRGLFERGLSTRTVQNVIFGALSPMLTDAARRGLRDDLDRPTHRLRWPRVDPPPPDIFLPDETEKILGWFKRYGPKYLPYVATIFLAGTRPSEAAGLQWGDIDWVAGSVSIRRAIVDRKVVKTKTRRSMRLLHVSPRLLEIYRGARPVRARPGDFLVDAPRGGPLWTNGFQGTWWKRCIGELELRPRSIYKGRGSYISKAAQRAPLPLIAAFVGNTIAVCERHYIKWALPLQDPATHGEAQKRHRA